MKKIFSNITCRKLISQMSNKSFWIILILLQSLLFPQQIYIRLNQVGFLTNESKSAIIFSNDELNNDFFSINDFDTDEIIFSGNAGSSIGSYGKFSNSYSIDFTNLRTKGKFYFKLRNERSHPFSIGDSLYKNIVDSLLTFFRIQRCGFNSPLLHNFCHYYDATSLVQEGSVLNEKKDLTGGWHDAGDFVKFFNTTAYTAYTLLFSYDFDIEKFQFDLNNNNTPDIIEEAKIGVDWLVKANFNNYMFITQIQDLRDQNQGWRLPEDDDLTHDRPGFLAIGKNLIGIYSAVMSLAFRVFSKFPEYKDYADNCLLLAKKFYSLKEEAPDLDKSITGNYQDTKYAGKLALGAIELYLSTNDSQYLEEAKSYAAIAGSDFWWSWGDINSFAHYRLAKIEWDYAKYILNNLLFFAESSGKNIFSEAISDTWGANSANLGVSLQSILWNDLTGDTTFSKLSIAQRDYILGKNPWGISFIFNVGSVSTQHFHSQVAFFNEGRLTGAVSAGPISKEKLNQYNIEYENYIDEYEEFQTDYSVYRDDRMDYVTNEPTITANATAIFVFGYYSRR